MALVQGFEVDLNGKGSLHPTHVTAKVRFIRAESSDGIVQIDTFGSEARKFEGKVSQTLQLDRRAAKELIAILERAFP